MEAETKVGNPRCNLSHELIANVLCYCTPRTILRFARTCKRYLQLVESSSRLRVHIELSATGLGIVGGSIKDDTPSSSILKEITRHRRNWLDLEYAAPTQLMVEGLRTPWRLRDGIFASAITIRTPGEDQPRRARSAYNSLLFTSLSPLAAARRIDFETSFADYCFDVEQELVVLIDTTSNSRGGEGLPRIFLRSTSDGLPHPHAMKPKLMPDFGSDQEESSRFRFSTSEIMNNTLLVKFTDRMPGRNPHISEIWLWDWVSGAVLGRIARNKSQCQVCFLDEQHLLVFETTQKDISLAIYTIPLPLTGSRRFEAFAAEPDPMISPTLVFRFPELHDSQKFFDGRCSLESGGTHSGALRVGSTTLSRPQVLTLALRVRLTRRNACLCGRGGNGTMEFYIFVSVSKLLNIMEQHAKLGTTEIPWEAWGESSTRWFTSEVPQGTSVYRDLPPMPNLSGSRYFKTITLTPSEIQDGSDDGTLGSSQAVHFLSVLDFHPPTVNRYANHTSDVYFDPQQLPANDEAAVEHAIEKVGHVPEDALKEWRASSEFDSQRKLVYAKTVGYNTPTVIKDGFAEPVVSRLPYRVVTRLSSVPGYRHWLIDGNNIIGSDSGVFASGSIYTIGPASASQEASNTTLGGESL